MFKNENVAHSPYGAYELKATYQRNFILSNLIVNGIVIIALIAYMIFLNSESQIVIIKPPPIEITRNLIQPPSITNDTPPVNVRPPQEQLPAVEQLPPIDDDALVEDDAEVIEDEVIPDTAGSIGMQGTGTNIGPITFEEDGQMPGLDQFVPVEQIPQFIYKAIPVYPRMERMAGIEGTVWIAVEVDINGNVVNAKVYKTSGRSSFDQAALAVAFENTFRPAIQNKNPIKLWIAYEVEFILKR